MLIFKASKKIRLAFLAVAALSSIIIACKTLKPTPEASSVAGKTPRVLVFSKTNGFYHESIPTGIAAIQKLGKENNIIVDTTKNASYFVEDSLKNYSAVIFLSTTMNVLNGEQQVAFERFIQAGGGFVGIHAAADTEYDWPWYNKLVGAYFMSHPHNQKAVINVKDKSHASTSFLPDKWERFDEWYNYKNINPDVKVLATLDESSYQGGKNGENHPTVWYHEFDGGRSFYTGGGHTNESYAEPLFLQHLFGGIKYAIGNNKLDFSKSYAVKTPEENRFIKTVLSNDLNEPMELAVAPDGRVFMAERTGKLFVYDPAINKTKLVYDFPVKGVEKYLNGLLGMSIDPDFTQNKYLYFFHTTQEGEQLKQNISRIAINDDNTLNLSTQKVIIDFPIDAEVSAHTGGSLAWDKNKNLYISTGDNTVPFESDGFAPIDEREGRITFDAQRSSGNTNDLRGKILRIHPEADGSYTIPEGNLFTKGTANTRPEIYVMGCRNPYRISVDQETSIVYWGEVGPDSGTDGKQGPRGYDEINQAKKAGNYGWPYFVGNNKAYHEYAFATKAVGELYNATVPTNNSALNTGLKTLPPAQNAMVFYPYNKSEEFPELGTGGRCAMGGPMYHFNAAGNAAGKFPEYYDKALFVYDWMRNWVFAVRLDENQNYKRIEQFMPVTGDFRRPVDIEFSEDGIMYMLEYGSVYGIDNTDARLVRIDFNGGNRTPVAKITTKDTIGLAPYKVAFNSKKSYDYDEEDKLSYEWMFDGKSVTSKEANPTYKFEKNGIYKTILKVTDASGQSNLDTIEIKVGNTLPLVAINTSENKSFFFANTTPFKYEVDVKDNEDKIINKKNVKVTLNYIPKVSSSQPLIGHQKITQNYNLGKSLIANSDCKACHQLNGKSVGPAFMQISEKYKNDKNAVSLLANKIIKGGGGVWGEHAMSAHPQLSKEEASDMVKYILSVSVEKEQKTLPQQGTVLLKDHLNQGNEGRYILSASYTDNGGAITPLSSTETIILRPAKIAAGDADILDNINKDGKRLGSIHDNSYFVFKNIDLKGIEKLTYRFSSQDKSAMVEVHKGSPDGPVISTLNYTATGDWKNYKELSAPVKDPGGINDLYFVFVKKDQPNQHLFNMDWIRFDPRPNNKTPNTAELKTSKREIKRKL